MFVCITLSSKLFFKDDNCLGFIPPSSFEKKSIYKDIQSVSQEVRLYEGFSSLNRYGTL